jgi:hypothetical protein
MSKDYNSIAICSPAYEIKTRYVYENGEVYKRRSDGTKGMKRKKHTGARTKGGFYWKLLGERCYENFAKLHLQDPPNPQ